MTGVSHNCDGSPSSSSRQDKHAGVDPFHEKKRTTIDARKESTAAPGPTMTGVSHNCDGSPQTVKENPVSRATPPNAASSSNTGAPVFPRTELEKIPERDGDDV